jgi:hypothetical protein
MKPIERSINASETETNTEIFHSDSNRIELFVVRLGFGLWNVCVNEIKD